MLYFSYDLIRRVFQRRADARWRGDHPGRSDAASACFLPGRSVRNSTAISHAGTGHWRHRRVLRDCLVVEERGEVRGDDARLQVTDAGTSGAAGMNCAPSGRPNEGLKTGCAVVSVAPFRNLGRMWPRPGHDSLVHGDQRPFRARAAVLACVPQPAMGLEIARTTRLSRVHCAAAPAS